MLLEAPHAEVNKPSLDSVPARWRVGRLKDIASSTASTVDKKAYEGQLPVKLCNYVDVYHNDAVVADLPFMEATASPDEVARFSVRAGEVVITKDSESANDIGIAAYVAADLPGVVYGYHLAILRARPNADGRFIKRLFDSQFVKDQLATRANGLTRVGLGQNALTSVSIPIPPLAEQRQIAEYLDRETGQIDALIAKQEQLVETLTERRQALIFQAVTTGIDPGIESKDSGLDWLGKIPQHWTLKRIKDSVASTKNGTWGFDPDGGSQDIWCVRVADFDRPSLATSNAQRTLRKVPDNERIGRVLRRGDLLLEKSGGGEKSPVGFVAIFDHDEPAVCSNFVARMTLREQQHPRYWLYLHAATYGTRLTQRSIKQTSGIQNLDQSSYFNERVGFPPIDEQLAIAEYLDDATFKVDALIEKAREMNATLRERRQALISAAVTGKIDVRGL